MMKLSRLCLGLAVMLSATAALGADTKTYLYDGQGRMVATTRAGTPTSSYVSYSFDGVGNRLVRRTVLIPARVVSSELREGESIVPAQTIFSPSGNARLVQQADGNLVLYAGSVFKWATNTPQGKTVYATMRPNGRLTLYDADETAIWTSPGNDSPGARLIVQDDCNVVIYNGFTPIWATGTQC